MSPIPSSQCLSNTVKSPSKKHGSSQNVLPLPPPRRTRVTVVAHQAKDYAPAGQADNLAANLVDIHEQRLRLMDQFGVDMQVLSLTSPGPQGTPRAPLG
jgi:hypothetical protein